MLKSIHVNIKRYLFCCGIVLLAGDMYNREFQLEKSQSAKKSVQRELTDQEEEVSRLNAQRRRVQRELDEATESLEASQREISALKSRLR